MNITRTIFRRAAVLMVAMGTLITSPATAPAQSGDCYAIGMQQAAQVGGQLARATAETRGGQTVCVIVVLMPARDGQRPRRSEIVVPLG